MPFRRATLAAFSVAIILGACADRPDPAASPRLDSGVTSSFGGGMQVLGNPGVGVTTRTR